MELTTYQREIIQITGCKPEESEEIEHLMYAYFNGNLGKVKCSTFARMARKIYRHVQKVHA